MERLKVRRYTLYATIISGLALLLMGIVSIQYSNYVDRRNKQQWCEIITTMDNAYSETPPTSSLGQKLADEFHRLRREFRCK